MKVGEASPLIMARSIIDTKMTAAPAMPATRSRTRTVR